MYGILKSVVIKSKQDGKMHNIKQADLIKTGIPNDVHCDGGEMQVSILPEEIISQYEKETGTKTEYGQFGENLVIAGMDYKALKVGDSISLGDSRLQITHIGASKSHTEKSPCKQLINDNYIFCKVLVEGIITVDDQVYLE